MKGEMKMTSRRKLSKKAQREENRKRREFWPMSPVTRVKESRKIYNRKKGWDVDG